MNPLTNVKNLNKMNDGEIKFGRVGGKSSWHNQYRESAWVFFAGMPYELTEGDLICVFSQYGEIVNINLIRDRKTGKSRGFGFLCYENQMSTDLAVDNFNGTKIIGRVIRVDHVNNYRPPKDHEDADEISKILREKGCLNFDLSEISSSNKSTKAESGEKRGDDTWAVKLEPATPREPPVERREERKRDEEKKKNTSRRRRSSSDRFRSASPVRDKKVKERKRSRSTSRDRKESKRDKHSSKHDDRDRYDKADSRDHGDRDRHRERDDRHYRR